MITVFFDGKCGLCSKEIRYYQRVAPDNVFRWEDIARDPRALDPINVTQADALRRLHVRDAAGRLHVGVAAFAAIWDHLSWWRYLAIMVRVPGVFHLAQFLYGRFADYRFARLPHCQIAD